MIWLDLVLVGFATLAVAIGWRAGLLRGGGAFLGMIVGIIIGVTLVPGLISALNVNAVPGYIITAASVVILAAMGNALGSWAGQVFRGLLKWRPAQWLDHSIGAVLGLFGFILVAWILIALLAFLPTNTVSTDLANSRVLASLNARMPEPVRFGLDQAESALQSATLPVISGGGFFLPTDPAPPPTINTVLTPEVEAVLDSVVRVSGNKPSCSTGATGSGYVSTPEHVTTNAHVVAGMTSPRITLRNGKTYRAEVVALEADIDVAVLYVPGLPLSPIPTSTESAPGTVGTVAGYPGGGELTLVGGSVVSEISNRQAIGTDIYGNGGVGRNVLVLSTQVVPGNSGGPFLGTDGRVLGLIFAQALEDPTVGYALTATQFRETSRAYGDATTPINTGACPVG